MKKPLSLKKILAVRCPTCGAAPSEKCELTTGQPRTKPHRDRRLIAKEMETIIDPPFDAERPPGDPEFAGL